MILVSVIIPCFNVSGYLEECVESVLKQTHRNIEIICVNNNSTDHTGALLEKINLRISNMSVLQETNRGANYARNTGLKHAKGEWIQFLDADDLLQPTKIAYQAAIAEKNPSASFIAGAYQRKSVTGETKVYDLLEKNKYKAVFKNQCGNTCSNLWQKEAIENVGGWDVKLASSQEADLMNRIILNGGHFIIDEQPLTIVRDRTHGQISQSDPALKWRRYIEVNLKYIESLKTNDPSGYKNNLSFYQDMIVITLLTLAKYDLQSAEYYFERYIKKDWRSDYKNGLNIFKVKAIQIAGFKNYLLFNRILTSFLVKHK